MITRLIRWLKPDDDVKYWFDWSIEERILGARFREARIESSPMNIYAQQLFQKYHNPYYVKTIEAALELPLLEAALVVGIYKSRYPMFLWKLKATNYELYNRLTDKLFAVVVAKEST